MGKALDFVLSEPWAILPESLEQILAIANRQGEDLEALAARLGRPLENTREVTIRGDVAVIPIRGPISRRANLFTEISGATSLELLAKDFNTAIESPSIRRIVLDIDSPGGAVAGISEFAAMVNKSEKPVTAYVENMAASAAYWIASAADKIIMSDTAMAGSIGVVGTYRPDKSDTVRIISTQSPLKQATPDTEKGLAEVQARVDDLAAVFIGAVAKYRGVTREKVLADFGQGGIKVGEKAVSAGMADRIGSLESVIAGSAGETHEGITMTEKNTQTPEITRDYLAANHSGILEDVKTEGYALGHKDGLAEGATAEMGRIQSVLDQSLPGYESLIQDMAFDGATTGPEAAVAVLAAEKKSRANHQQKMNNETPEPVAGGAPPEDVSADDSGLSVEERCKKKWDASADVRNEFSCVETFTAYTRAVENGQVKRIGGVK